MEGLPDDGPLVIQLDERVEVGIVESAGILLHVDLDHSRGRCDAEHVQARLDVWRLADRVDIAVQVLDGAAEEVVVGCEAVHCRVLVEGLAQDVVVAGAEAVDVGLHRLYHGIVF